MSFIKNTFLLGLMAGVAWAEPLVTAAAQLAPRATDPSFVGYISQSGGYGNARTCNYPETVSTSGGYVQCCPATGSCPFYTTCSDNTLYAAGSVTVPCYVGTALTCNTAIVLPTIGAQSGASYLACWQQSLGSSAFTIVQNVGSASVVQATTTASVGTAGSTGNSAAASSTASNSSAMSTSSEASMSSSSSSSASASSKNAAANVDGGLAGGFVGAVAMLAQLFL